MLYLDLNTTTAIAQLQLLRDSADSWGHAGDKFPWLIAIHFNFHDSSEDYVHVYYVELRRPPDGVEFPVDMGALYGVYAWALHERDP